VVLIEGGGQGFGPARLLGVVGEAREQGREPCGNRGIGLIRWDAELPRDLVDGASVFELLHQRIK
jgi:hypothetical protein